MNRKCTEVSDESDIPHDAAAQYQVNRRTRKGTGVSDESDTPHDAAAKLPNPNFSSPSSSPPPMDAAAKKHALRLVPYGLYLAGARHGDGRQSVSLVSWFTQASFDPPLVVLGLHKDGESLKGAKETGVLSLNLLGAAQKDLVKPFFKHVDVQDGKAGPLESRPGPATGCPLLPALPASLELKLRQLVEMGDHAIGVFEVVDAHVHDKEATALDHKGAALHYAG